jgi:phage terminase large subunit-like protein
MMDETLARLLAQIEYPELLRDNTEAGTRYRRLLTQNDPLLFAVVYLPKHLKDDDGNITFSETHVEWGEVAQQWMTPPTKARQRRHAFLAPRSTGKSTWWFLIFPIWWAAHGYTDFIAAFADSAEQAERHLKTFKMELEENELLNLDFPELCKTKRRPRGTSLADAQNIRISANDFVFIAKGVDSQSLGMKIGNRRPKTILRYDIEPDEANYSHYKMTKRLMSIQDAVLPLNVMANVVLSGTTTMPGSITHQLVKSTRFDNLTAEEQDQCAWVKVENFKVHHAKPIRENEDGSLRSFWPNNPKFVLEDMLRIRNSREFKKNYENDPMSFDSEYWKYEDFKYGSFECTRTYLSIDGAVTSNKNSDYTAIAVVGYRPATNTAGNQEPAKCLVKYCVAVKEKGSALRQRVLSLLEEFPEVSGVLVETNQGGELWLEILHNIPVPVKTLHNSEKKESRAGRLLNLYQMSPARVVHTVDRPLTRLEEEMVGFPKFGNDDSIDAVGNIVLQLLGAPGRRRKLKTQSISPR